MTRLMMNCPETGKPIYTGIVLPKRMFDVIRMPATTISPCPACENEHAFQKDDVYLEPEDSPPPRRFVQAVSQA
jgi:hypothetical protein